MSSKRFTTNQHEPAWNIARELVSGWMSNVTWRRPNKCFTLKEKFLGRTRTTWNIRNKSSCGLWLIIFFILCTLILLSGCGRRGDDGLPLVAVSIVPQEWFVSRIGGDRARTLVLAGQGQNPHNYEPTPRQISGLVQAGARILSGAEFEITLRPKIEKLFPALPIIDGTAGVVMRKPDSHDDDEHEHGELDRHTWLGREPAKILAAHIRDTLSMLDPAGAEYYAENYVNLAREIDAEFAVLRRELAPLRGSNVFVYHPSFGYFLDEFGIKQQAVETGGKTPGPRELSRLIALAQQERPAAIFVQAQFPVSAAKTVADSVGAATITLDPLARDWLANIRRMGDALWTQGR
jgi:zinc transport system substrate-binding protein